MKLLFPWIGQLLLSHQRRPEPRRRRDLWDRQRLPRTGHRRSGAGADRRHFFSCVWSSGWLRPGVPVRGEVDAVRRRDHMQQHSGQHVLSAAFEKLYSFATVSFHMGDEAAPSILPPTQTLRQAIEAAERLANEIIAEDRPVEIRFATADEARSMGVRKIPPAEREKLRLIDIRDFDLNACGGTHVRSTGQIGAILLRKTEKVKQGMRVEFVCGCAPWHGAADFETLTDAAALFSTHIWEVPQQIRKSLDESEGRAEDAAPAAGRSRRTAGLQTAASRRAAQGAKSLWSSSSPTAISLYQDAGAEADHPDKTIALLACGGTQPRSYSRRRLGYRRHGRADEAALQGLAHAAAARATWPRVARRMAARRARPAPGGEGET